MQITIHKSGELLDSTKAVINEKISKLETFYDRIERADVYVKEDDGTKANGHKVEVRLAVPGNDLFAESEDPNIKKGIADVAEALRRQIKKHKEKLKDFEAASKDLPPVGPNDDAAKIYQSESEL